MMGRGRRRVSRGRRGSVPVSVGRKGDCHDTYTYGEEWVASLWFGGVILPAGGATA